MICKNNQLCMFNIYDTIKYGHMFDINEKESYLMHILNMIDQIKF